MGGIPFPPACMSCASQAQECRVSPRPFSISRNIYEIFHVHFTWCIGTASESGILQEGYRENLWESYAMLKLETIKGKCKVGRANGVTKFVTEYHDQERKFTTGDILILCPFCL